MAGAWSSGVRPISEGARHKARFVAAAAATKQAPPTPTSAKECIEAGLKVFDTQRDVAGATEAARLFTAALDLNASDDEKCAALYNLGCANTKLKLWKPAADAILRAVNEHRLKLTVALNDDDLRALRDRREWIDALTEIKGGLSRDMKNELRSEARAPFRFPRLIILGGLGLGAALGLFVTTIRLIKALQGAEGAPDLTETVTNFGINAAVAGVLGAVLIRDQQEKAKATRVTNREELLSRLQVDLGNGRVLPLLRFRGKVRFIILTGTKAFVDRAVKEAEKYYTDLRERGISLVPLVLEASMMGGGQAEVDMEAKLRALKKEFSKRDTSKGFADKSTSAASAPAEEEPVSDADAVKEDDKKWKLAAFDAREWVGWVTEQRDFANLGGSGSTDCYIQVQLDGTVRTSGLGMPNWKKMLDDLPELDSVRTTFTDGIGPGI